MADFDPDLDKVLEDLGAVPGFRTCVAVKQYGDSPPRVVFYAQGRGDRTYPVKKLTLGEALALPAFLEEHRARIAAHL